MQSGCHIIISSYHRFIDSFVYLSIHPCIHLSIHPFFCSFIHVFLLICHSFSYLLMHPLITFFTESNCSWSSSTTCELFWRNCPMAASCAASFSSKLLFNAVNSCSLLLRISVAAAVVSIDSSSSDLSDSSSWNREQSVTSWPAMTSYLRS